MNKLTAVTRLGHETGEDRAVANRVGGLTGDTVCLRQGLFDALLRFRGSMTTS
jgi:hypothetical protein